MLTANEVDASISELISSGMPLQDVAWKIANFCVGWAYVFGARGEYCDPSNRRSRASDAHPTIKSKCKNFNGRDSVPAGCVGCRWFLSDADADESKHEGRTRFFDCRGFTYWVLLKVYGWKLSGAGATSQWNTASNWKEKGTIATIPDDKLVCLFVRKGNKMEHTGFGYHGETVESSVGVQHFDTRNKKWTHWAIPACESPTPPDPDRKPTLRKGDKGAFVTLAQTELIQQGYDCGSWGADGDFGSATESAVKRFQSDHTDEHGNPLKVDGVIGDDTWWALDNPTSVLYTVTVPHLSKSQATALVSQYPGSTMTEERG